MPTRKIEQWCPEGRGKQKGYQIRWASSVYIPSGHPLGLKSSSWAYQEGVTETTACTLLPECTGLGHPSTNTADSGSTHRFHPRLRQYTKRPAYYPPFLGPISKCKGKYNISNTQHNSKSQHDLHFRFSYFWFLNHPASHFLKFTFANQNHRKSRENHFYLISSKISHFIGSQPFTQAYINKKRHPF